MPKLRRATHTKEEPSPDLQIITQLDALQDAADDERDTRLGGGWFEDVRNFYNVDPQTYQGPSFRPKMTIPELQVLMLNEATDLSDALPRIYIAHKQARDKEREKAFQENWKQSNYNNRLLEGEIWSLFGGTGFIQVGVDVNARHGKGEVFLESRDPDSVHPDPSTKDWQRWAYVQFDDRMYIDEVRARWDKAWGVIPRRGPAPGTSYSTATMGTGLRLPAGPMSVGPGTTQKLISTNSIVSVRHSFIRDYTTKEIPKEERERLREVLDPLIAIPTHRRMFPNGRWIVDCEGVVLADGPNPFPLGLFPIFPLRALPSLGWFWGIPPIRYTRTLQQIAERMYTQNFENAIRLNNGIWFIDEATGITADDFSGLPAEITVINSNSKVPEVRWPAAMPAHMMQMPQTLLELQRKLQGHSDARGGETSPGNQSADLYDSTIYQSKAMTRLRSRLLAEPIQRIAEMIFYCMCSFYRDNTAFAGISNRGELQYTKWADVTGDYNDYDIVLDPASLKPVSMTALRGLVQGLLQKGQIPLDYALNVMEFPNASEVAETMKQEQELAALGKLKRPR